MKNIIIIGSGLIGKVHAELCINNPNVNFLGFIVSDINKCSNLRDEFNCLVFETIDDALKVKNIDGVIIASPTNIHMKHWLECLEHNIPALIEKPMLLNTKEFFSIPKKYRNIKVLQNYTVGHHRLHGSNILNAKKIIDSGSLGEIKMIQNTTAWVKPDYYFKDGIWRTDHSQGGGVLLINLIHEIATVRFLLGEFEYVSAFSTKPSRSFSVEDTVSVSFKLKSGIVGSFSITDICPGDQSWECNSSENLKYPQYKNDSFTIYGSDATLKLPSNTLIYHDGNNDWWESVEYKKDNFNITDPLAEQLNEFLQLLNGNSKHRVTVMDGLKNILVIEAINESIISRSAKKVDDFIL